WEDSASGALHGAERDQRPDVPRGGGADAAGEEDRERDRQQSSSPVLVAELPEHRRRNGGDEQEDGQYPRHPGGRRVQVVLERGQRRDDHRLLEGERRPRESQDRQRDVVVLPTLSHLSRLATGWGSVSPA